MANDQVVCPLCDGLSKIPREELIRKLSDPLFRSRIDQLLAGLKAASGLHPEPVAASAGRSDFETKVHSWNPANPMWNRSPKE